MPFLCSLPFHGHSQLTWKQLWTGFLLIVASNIWILNWGFLPNYSYNWNCMIKQLTSTQPLGSFYWNWNFCTYDRTNSMTKPFHVPKAAMCLFTVFLPRKAWYNLIPNYSLSLMQEFSSISTDSGNLPRKSFLQGNCPSIHLQVCSMFAFATLFWTSRLVKWAA